MLHPCLPVHSAWHMSAFHRAVTAPSTLQPWCPQPPSQMPCSLTACPTRSTWPSSKPRLPVPKTFTRPCWTVPTRSQARRLHHLLALGALSEVAWQGVGLALGDGGQIKNEDWPKPKSPVVSHSFSPPELRRREPAGGSRGQQGEEQDPTSPLLRPLLQPSLSKYGL